MVPIFLVWTGVHTKDLLIDTSWSQNQKIIRFCPHSVNGWLLNVAGPNSGLSGTPHLIFLKKKQENISVILWGTYAYSPVSFACTIKYRNKGKRPVRHQPSSKEPSGRLLHDCNPPSCHFITHKNSKEWRLMQIDSGPANWTLARRRLVF